MTYKIRSQGQRFRRKDFGDLGLRAYKEQQNTIINALKLQAKQSEQVRNEYIRGEEQSDVKEEQNRVELKKLEDDVYKNKADAKKVRATREIESLLGKAKEFGKKADFFKDFSTTYSKQYAEAAKSIIGGIEKQVGERGHQAFKESGQYNERIEGEAALNNLSSAYQVKEAYSIYTDKSLSRKEKAEKLGHVIDIGKRMGHTNSLLTANSYIKDFKLIETNLVETVRANGIELDKDSVYETYMVRAYELIRNSGMSPTSKGSKKLLDHFHHKAIDKQNRLTKESYAERDTETTESLITDLKNLKDDPAEYEFAYNKLIMHTDSGWTWDSNNNPVEPSTKGNLSSAQTTVMKLLVEAGVFNTREEAGKHLLNIATPDQQWAIDIDANIKRKTWGNRHAEKETELDEIWNDYSKQERKDAEDAAKNKDADSLKDVQARVRSGEIDVSNKQQMQGILDNNRGNPNTRDWLSTAMLFNPNEKKDIFLVDARMNAAYLGNDWADFQDVIQYMPDKDRPKWNKIDKHLGILNRNGHSSKDVKKLAKAEIAAVMKVGAINDYSHGSSLQAAEGFEQVFYEEFRKVADDENLTETQKIDKALTSTRKMLTDKVGVFRRENEGNATIWLAYTDEDKDSLKGLDKAQLEEKLKNGWDNIFNQASVDRPDKPKGKITVNGKTVNLIKQDSIDRTVRAAVQGKEIEQNDTIDLLYLTQPLQPDGKLKYSKTDLWNKILKLQGIDAQIPPGQTDLVQWKAERSAAKVSNWHQLSDKNKAAVSVVLELADFMGMPTSKELDPTNPNYFVTKEEFLYNYPYFTGGLK